MLRNISLSVFALFLLSLSSPVVAAGKYAIKQMTPSIQSALDNRRERFEDLRALKSSGSIGENNHGYVEVLVIQGNVEGMVAAENKDRKIIYQTIAEQNELEDAIATIESVFAQVQRDKAEAGDKVQGEDGQWISK